MPIDPGTPRQRTYSPAPLDGTIQRILAVLSLLALVLSVMPLPILAQTPASEPEDRVTVCDTSDFGYSVTFCLTAPAPNIPIGSDPIIQASVEIDNPDIRIRAVVFELDGRQVLSDFDPPYEFRLPLKHWADGTYELSGKVRLSGDIETAPIGTLLTFNAGVVASPEPEVAFEPRSGRAPEPGAPFVLAVTGDAAGGSPESAAVTSLIASWDPNLFLYLGDVYNAGTKTEYDNWYAPETFLGRFREITNPTVGNHEYAGRPVPDGYMYYWGDPPNYYNVVTNGWNIISIDSNARFNQMSPGSEQMLWLRQTLESSSTPCTLVFLHHPRFSAGPHGDIDATQDVWRLLVEMNVSLVLAAHDHNYQRLQPLDADGYVDPSAPVTVIVGSGGQSENAASPDDVRLAAPPVKTSGALRAELNPNGAALQYFTTDGVVRDTTVVGCDSSDGLPDSSPPSAPGAPQAVRNQDGSVVIRWSPALDDTGILAYDVYRNGVLIGSAPPASTYVDLGAGELSEPEYRVIARDAAGNQSAPTAAIFPKGRADPSIVFTDDFSSQSLGRWTDVSGLAVEPQAGAPGSWVARARGGLAPAYARLDLPEFPADIDIIDVTVTIDFRILDQGTNPAVLFRLRSTDGASILGVSVGESGLIGLFNDVTGSGSNGRTPITYDKDHQLTVRLFGTYETATVSISLDGVEIDELTTTFSLEGKHVGGVQLGDSRRDRVYDIEYKRITIAANTLLTSALPQLTGSRPNDNESLPSFSATPVASPSAVAPAPRLWGVTGERRQIIMNELHQHSPCGKPAAHNLRRLAPRSSPAAFPAIPVWRNTTSRFSGYE